MHVQDPEAVIKVAKNSLSPDGVVVSQEPIISSSIYTKLPEYKETLAVLTEKLGVNYNVGDRLASLYQKAGFSCTVEEHRPMLTPLQAKSLHLLGLSEWKDKAIRANLLQQKQAEEWEHTIKSWPEEGDVTSFYTPPINVYIIATKKE